MLNDSEGFGVSMQRGLQPTAPSGAYGADADRDPATGRFQIGNKAALVVGARSTAFWASQASARREIEAAIIRDAGHAPADAPEALRLAAASIAQAVLVQGSAFARLVESGGPLTTRGRSRRAFDVWLSALDRVERYLRLVGLKRVPKDAGNVAEAFARLHEEHRCD